MRSSSLATLMTKKLFKIATILDDLFFLSKDPVLWQCYCRSILRIRMRSHNQEKTRVSHLKKCIFHTHTHTYKCHITIQRLNFVMRRKLLRTFSSNPKSRPTQVECLKSLGAEENRTVLGRGRSWNLNVLKASRQFIFKLRHKGVKKAPDGNEVLFVV